MKKVIISISVIILISNIANAYTDYNDGGKHIINWSSTDSIRVDWETPQAGTQVDIISGGRIEFLKAYNDSMINISGGEIGARLETWDNSHATISGGLVSGVVTARSSLLTMSSGVVQRSMSCNENSLVNISGGSIGTFSGAWLSVHRNSQLLITGGTIDASLSVYDDGQITISGSNFAIDGITVDYGQYYASNYPYGKGTLTGTLANGDILDGSFNIYDDASIVLVPEPATILLLSLGGLVLRKRK